MCGRRAEYQHCTAQLIAVHIPFHANRGPSHVAQAAIEFGATVQREGTHARTRAYTIDLLERSDNMNEKHIIEPKAWFA